MSTSGFLEDRVVQLPELARVPAPPSLFVRFVDELAPMLPLPSAISALIEPYTTEELRLQATLRTFESFREDSAAFIKFIRVLRNLDESEELTIQRATQLYGLNQCRDLFTALSIIRSVHPKPAVWNHKLARPAFEAPATLRYALRAESRLGEGSRYPHHVYSAAAIFDAFRLYAETRLGVQSQMVVDFIEQQYIHGERTAKVLIALSKKMKTLELVEYAIPAALLHDVGKAALAVLDPAYVTATGVWERNQLPRSLRVFAEERLCGITHPLMSYLVVRTCPSLHPMGKIVLHHHDSYVLNAPQDKPLQDLAATLSLSSNIARTLMALPVDAAMESRYNDKNKDSLNQEVDEAVRKFWLRTELPSHELSSLDIYGAVQGLKQSEAK